MARIKSLIALGMVGVITACETVPADPRRQLLREVETDDMSNASPVTRFFGRRPVDNTGLPAGRVISGSVPFLRPPDQVWAAHIGDLPRCPLGQE